MLILLPVSLFGCFLGPYLKHCISTSILLSAGDWDQWLEIPVSHQPGCGLSLVSRLFRLMISGKNGNHGNIVWFPSPYVSPLDTLAMISAPFSNV